MTRAGQLKFTLRKTLKQGRNIGVQKRLSFVFICDDIYIYIYIKLLLPCHLETKNPGRSASLSRKLPVQHGCPDGVVVITPTVQIGDIRPQIDALNASAKNG